MPEGQGYQSGLIAALRGSSPNDAPTTPGIQFLPNAPMAPFNPMSFGSPQMSGNLMTPPNFQRPQSAAPMQRELPQRVIQLGSLPLPIPDGVPDYGTRPRMGVTPGPLAETPQSMDMPFVLPPMTGNLMPAPDMPRAPDYVPPPPPAPVQPPAPQINYEMDEEGNRTGAIIGVGPDGEPYRYFPSFE
jgi:hypothetical protein